MIRASTSKQKDVAAAVNPLRAVFTIGLCMFLIISLGLLVIISTHIIESGLALHMLGKISRIILAAFLTMAFFLFVWRCLSLCIDSSLRAVEVGRIRLDTIGGVLKLFLFLQIIFFVSVFCCLYAFPVTESHQGGPAKFLKYMVRSEHDVPAVDSSNVIRQDSSIENSSNLLQSVVPAQKEGHPQSESNIEASRNANIKKTELIASPALLSAIKMEKLASTDLFPVRLRGNSETNLAVPEDSRLRLTKMQVNFGATGGDFALESLFNFHVDHPDLIYRSREEVRSQFPLLFEELPLPDDASLAATRGPEFDSRFKNPCWISRRAPKGVGAPISSDLTQGQLVCLPYVYVLGQPKCGTSDLFERMKQHHMIRMPKKKEVRWFTRGEFTTTSLPHEGDSDSSGRRERLLGTGSSVFSFTRFFASGASEIAVDRDRRGGMGLGLLLVDGGPHTLWWPTQSPDGSFLPEDVPPPQLLREIQPNAKFIITLTDPVKRMYSDYYFLEDNLRPVQPGPTTKSALQFHGRAAVQVRAFYRCIEDYQKFLVDHSDGGLLSAVPRSGNVTWFRAAQMCAHDRHQFAKAGWGRLSIGLYFLFLEKWLEHFSPEQFLIVRLEDYDVDPTAYMMRIFTFLGLEAPKDWSTVLRNVRFNQHRVEREPILQATEQLLRDFYEPYNKLLAEYTGNSGFLWHRKEGDATLREEQMKENKNDGGSVSLKNPHVVQNIPPPPPIERINQHGLERHFEIEEPELLAPPQNRRSDVAKVAALAQQPPRFRGSADLNMVPDRFSTEGLENPKNESLDFLRTFFNNVAINTLLVDPPALAGQLCMSSFGLDIPALRYLLLVKGVSPDLEARQYASVTALHCVSEIYTMADAHGRSHVFALLKGKTSWLTPLLQPALPLHLASVLTRDIKDNLEGLMSAVVQWLLRAGAKVDKKDGGGNLALHHAGQGGSVVITRLLLAAGADPNALNSERRTPIHYALAFGHAQVAGILWKAGADLTLPDRNGVRPVDLVENPGAISPEDALRYMNISQRPARQIKRLIHPELSPNDSRLGWAGDTGGWGPERLPGFEDDMTCDSIDQYYAEEITGEEIYAKYIARNAPVLIRGLLKDWKAVQDNREDQLLSHHRNLPVQVSDIPYAQKFGGLGVEQMSLGEYVSEVRAHRIIGGSHPWYVFKGHPVPSVSEGADSLVSLESCPTPQAIQTAFDRTLSPPLRGRTGKKAREAFVNAQWAMGGEGTGAPIHFHNTAWSALIYGAKKWIIYPPHNQIMSNKQILDYFETDMRDFSKRGVAPLTCVQTAGDVVIIPENWGHGVLNLQESIAVASEARTGTWRIKPIAPIYDKFPGFRNAPDKKKGNE